VLHGLDYPALLPLERVPVGVLDPLRVRHPAEQRALEGGPGRVVREGVLRSADKNRVNKDRAEQVANGATTETRKQRPSFQKEGWGSCSRVVACPSIAGRVGKLSREVNGAGGGSRVRSRYW
jgi:hypothetical protein